MYAKKHMGVNVKILVLGYFGYHSNKLDGQTIKTRNVFDLLKSKTDSQYSIFHFDTQDFRYDKFSIFKLIKLLFSCDQLIYLPAHNNLTYIFPFVYLLSRIKRFDILYIVIGGWLAGFIKKKKLHRYMLARIKAVFPENAPVKNLLQNDDFDFHNVEVLPNFRLHDYHPEISVSGNKIKVVFMSRIIMEKGIDTIFRVADYLSEKKTSIDITIDFYGQIADKDKSFFEEHILKYNFISYRGVLQPADIYKTLSTYDVLILPTRYPEEGFPGAILDAYISGIPVIVSNWRYSKEYIENGVTGFICDGKSPMEFYDKIMELASNPQLLIQMKKSAYEKSKTYSGESVWQILQPYLLKNRNEY